MRSCYPPKLRMSNISNERAQTLSNGLTARSCGEEGENRPLDTEWNVAGENRAQAARSALQKASNVPTHKICMRSLYYPKNIWLELRDCNLAKSGGDHPGDHLKACHCDQCKTGHLSWFRLDCYAPRHPMSARCGKERRCFSVTNHPCWRAMVVLASPGSRLVK
jgi:hypothetical protein